MNSKCECIATWMIGPLLILLSLPSSSEIQPSIQQLVENDQLRIKTWIEPAQDIVAKQQIYLKVEVSTDAWFSRGTRIGRFEVDGAIVLRREKFAVNSTHRERDKTWSSQLWTITLYPQRAGRYEIPPLELDITVAAENNDGINGTVTTETISFETSVPAALETLSFAEKLDQTPAWLATTEFLVNERFDRALENVNAGDAIRRTIEISAADVAAMMLPKLRVEAQPGLAVYQKPAHIEDSVNRGNYKARRVESITYVVEERGDYRLEPVQFYWWDLTSQSLQTVELPERTITVSNKAPELNSSGAPTKNSIFRLLATLLVATGLATLAWFATRQLRRNRGEAPFTGASFNSDPQQVRAQLLKVCKTGNTGQVVALLYRVIDTMEARSNVGLLQPLLVKAQGDMHEQLEHLFRALYADDGNTHDLAGQSEKLETLVHNILDLVDHHNTETMGGTLWEKFSSKLVPKQELRLN
ncbi:MAG: BatD family protein [Pseudomonadales bacterium]